MCGATTYGPCDLFYKALKVSDESKVVTVLNEISAIRQSKLFKNVPQQILNDEQKIQHALDSIYRLYHSTNHTLQILIFLIGARIRNQYSKPQNRLLRKLIVYMFICWIARTVRIRIVKYVHIYRKSSSKLDMYEQYVPIRVVKRSCF